MLKALLLQIRKDQLTAQEEHEEFTHWSKLAAHDIYCINLLDKQPIQADMVDDYDLLFVGGSSDVSVAMAEQHPELNVGFELIQRCYARKIPVFASCFGFQMAVRALGGQVIIDKENMELGTMPIDCSPAAFLDPLMSHLPDPFYAVCGHQERAATIPEGFVNFARTEKCPYQAIGRADQLFYAFQFHPEMDRQALVDRYRRYGERYTEMDEEVERQLANFAEVDECNSLVERFIHLVRERKNATTA